MSDAMKTESLTVNREPLTGWAPARDLGPLGSGDELPFLGSGSKAGAAKIKTNFLIDFCL